MKRFQGAMPAVITPMHEDGTLDLDAFRDLVDWLVAEGSDGIVACGTTGEGATMKPEETLAVVQAAVDAVKGRVPVIAGTGSNDTRKSVDLTRAVKEQGGVDAALIVTPYYNKPTPEGLYRHYAAVAETGVPVLMYNVPGRTGLDMDVDTMVRCGGIDGVVGVKDASKSMEKALTVRQRLGEDFALLSGDDFTILPFLASGGDGVITVVGNVAPKDTAGLVKAFHGGDLAEAQRLQAKLLPLCDALFLESNPVPVKSALARMGKCQEHYRLPLVPPTDRTRVALEETMRNYGGLL